MVPKGWSHTTFEKHIDCLTGYAFSSTEYSAEEHDIRLLRGDNIEPGKLRWINAKRWPRNVQENMDKYFLLEGDFVIALDRTWISGGLKVAEVTCDDLPCLLVQRVARIRAKKTLAQGLLRQYFSGYKFERYVKLTQTATAVPHISPNDIKQFSLLLPPIAEQKKIAQILSTWDKAISVTEKLLANSQQQKKALMQQLLTGKKRLLDENGVRFSGEWCTCTLSEVAHIIMGSSPKSEAYNDNGLGLPLIQGNADIKCRVSCPRVYTSDITKECTPGDILLSVRAPVGTVALSQHKACIGRGISAIKSKRKMSQSFLYQWFLWFEPKWCYLSQGSTFESINSDDIKTLKLSVPNFEEQQKIAAVLSAADVEISTLEKKLACLKDEKKALMQQLLTGKRRVKVDEAVAA
ncbi:restriction endonuclease subunit S [Escherichia coli]|jgi:restriction endonuclease S subunit|uniref:Restriction endonuclease subunit S n=1 Tax=Escherichia coli TaxID=562 RepID=A0A8S7RFV5_ECOLX|nr:MULTISPECIES: restriction endonuclease subunit S [Enterobacteriaceae]ECC3398376.1 restriction endonuclease subunit S [Salmonella enterica subsp. enterica serovar Liverpool]ECI7839780.1 restriction endonuclease subunit S [Salmonella enterica subsp. enterica]EEZ9838229.1 restriction endonuclease subunit S [Escherichia coli O25]ECD6126389.1 restriction endonuclease subunit S [Salmonella enterica subsp. enterica serovar Liverpool]EDQ2796218.1 restriction endonuclease subunit S [Salmonella enter